MGTLILLRPVVSMASASPRYASHWIALPCSPLITRKREKSWDVLMDASYQSWACAVVLPKCTTPVANIRKNVQNQVARIRCSRDARFTSVADEGYSLCFMVLHYCWWFCTVILSLDTVPRQSLSFLVNFGENVSFCVQLMGVCSSDTDVGVI